MKTTNYTTTMSNDFFNMCMANGGLSDKQLKAIEEHNKSVEDFLTSRAESRRNIDVMQVIADREHAKKQALYNKLFNSADLIKNTLPTNDDIHKEYCYNDIFNVTTINNDKQLSVADISAFMKYEKKHIAEYSKYNDLDGFISYVFKPLSIAIIKSMYKGMRRKKDGDYIPSANYNAIHQIVENGYNDNLTDDIAQEIALVLVENKEDIQKDKDGFYTFDNSDIVLKCYRAINKFLYSYKTRNELKHVSICGWNEDTDTDITLRNGSIEWKMYILHADYNRKTKEDIIQITKDVLAEISHNEKPFIYEKCKIVMYGMLNGLLLKDISKKYDISIHSVTKYKNIILNAYNTLFKEYRYNKPLSVSKYNIDNNKLVNVNKVLAE